MQAKSYDGDVGTIILVDMQVDISAATNLSFHVLKPDNSIVVWYPVIESLRYLKYTIADGNFDIDGLYRLQPRMTLGAFSGGGNIVEFTIRKRIP